jgi:hypothetical protein
MLKIIGTPHEDVRTFMIISGCVVLRMKNISEESCTENRNKSFVFNIFFFENGAVYEIMLKKYITVR